ncbi:hypothetical protein [Tropicibacter oceani]|uniref:Cytochrome c family protein n=1 Tax=Tropicibacter oceani TaxID=3058420 RepID=A0ABY8QGY4_9RHOB|nr:hypothetical protein [Tropicibacter oceani]WGW03057.1 hypothetical protein QF118_14115 [Tropicibacter oceani]
MERFFDTARARAHLCSVSVIALCGLTAPAQAQNVLPTDAQASCAVDPTAFGTWFDSGTAAGGGAVKPANGFDFPPSATNTKCDFYKWGAQMFLWLTSPDPAGGVTIDGDSFYDVMPDGSGKRQFVPNDAGPTVMQTRSVKPIDSEGTGQAGGGDVLISANNSLVYYGVHANDIYAWFRTGVVDGTFTGDMAKDFPTTQAAAQQVVDYATAKGATISDLDASTMELKTSWVDASTVADKTQFVTASATVPKYTMTSDTQWTLDGTQPMELALVGIHIVAPVLGHPELVWISYEHVNNAPMADYVYTTTAGTQSLQAYSAKGDWIFEVDDTYTPPEIVPNASQQSNGDIAAATGMTIGPVQNALKNPWGVAPGPNNDAGNNTDLVSLNVSLMSQLDALGDVRGNYYQIGGIWTVDGQLPLGGSDGNIRGGLRLANSTMETFHQYPDHNGFTSENCFTCHSVSSETDPGVGVSHIFGSLNPLTQ